MSTLKIFLLGPPRLEHGGAPIKLPRQKSLALFIYLALTGRDHTREKLATLFWPAAPETHARQALRTALSDLRRSLGNDHLGAAAESVSAKTDSIWTDVIELEALVRDPLAMPLAVQFAPFLDGFSLKDAPDFDDWVAFERDRLQQLAVKALYARAQALEAQNRLPEAVAAAQQLLQVDNVHEEAHRQLMRLYWAQGDRPAALQQYEMARVLLQRELAVEPMEETRALYRQILEQARPAPSSRKVPRIGDPLEHGNVRLPFVGREAEHAALAQSWQSTQRGRAHFVFVEGEMGVGKTRLVEETLAGWENQALILRGRAHPLETNQPYHPFIDALRAYFSDPSAQSVRIRDLWLDEISRLVPELQTMRPNLLAAKPSPMPERRELVQAAQERNRLFEAISQFLLVLAKRNPVVLFLDDVHWADRSTLALLSHLSDSLLHVRLLGICAYRQGEASADLEDLLQTLDRAYRLTRIKLDRLGPNQVSELARVVSRQESLPFAEWLYHESEGNPLFLREMIAYLISSGRVRTDDRGWQTDLRGLTETLPSEALPSSVHDLIQARLHRLSEVAQQLIDVAAIIGRGFDFATLWRASGKEEDRALDALEELLHAQVIRQRTDAPNPYEFTHAKIREVVLADMSLARQQILHRRVGEALEVTQRERLPELGGVLALHFRSAGEWLKAARYARAAGDRALALWAPQEAVEQYTDALTSLGHEGDLEVTASVHMGLGLAYRALGQQDASISSYTSAQQIWERLGDRARVAETWFVIGVSHLFRAEYRQAYELAQRGLRDLADLEHPDPRIMAQGHALCGTALSMEGHALEDAKTHLHEAMQWCGQSDDYDGQYHALFELGSLAARQGDLEQAVAYSEQARQCARRGKHVMGEALACNNAAGQFLLRGDRVQANQMIQQGLALAEERSLAPALMYLYGTLAEIRLAEKNWTEAEAAAEKSMTLADQLNSPERRARYLANIAEVAYGRGDPQSAVVHLAAAAEQVDRMGLHYVSARYHLRLADMLIDQGRRAEAGLALQRGEQIAGEGHYRMLMKEAARVRQKLS